MKTKSLKISQDNFKDKLSWRQKLKMKSLNYKRIKLKNKKGIKQIILNYKNRTQNSIKINVNLKTNQLRSEI